MASNGPDPLARAAAPAGGSTLFNLARGAKLAALLLFFLPWVTVSCAGQELASMSGYDMAVGSVTVTNPMTGASETPPGAGERDLPVLVAGALILVSLVLTFVLARGLAALIAAGGAAGAAILIGYTVFVRVPAKMHGGSMGGGDPASAGFNEQQLAEMIRVEHAIGLWLTLLALAAAVALNLMSRRLGAT